MHLGVLHSFFLELRIDCGIIIVEKNKKRKQLVMQLIFRLKLSKLFLKLPDAHILFIKCQQKVYIKINIE